MSDQNTRNADIDVPESTPLLHDDSDTNAAHTGTDNQNGRNHEEGNYTFTGASRSLSSRAVHLLVAFHLLTILSALLTIIFSAVVQIEYNLHHNRRYYWPYVIRDNVQPFAFGVRNRVSHCLMEEEQQSN